MFTVSFNVVCFLLQMPRFPEAKHYNTSQFPVFELWWSYRCNLSLDKEIWCLFKWDKNVTFVFSFGECLGFVVIAAEFSTLQWNSLDTQCTRLSAVSLWFLSVWFSERGPAPKSSCLQKKPTSDAEDMEAQAKGTVAVQINQWDFSSLLQNKKIIVVCQWKQLQVLLTPGHYNNTDLINWHKTASLHKDSHPAYAEL